MVAFAPRDRFYLERDRRTVEYGIVDVFEAPVGVVVGADAASCPRGQIAVLSLVNMLCRIHRNLHLDIPRAALTVEPLLGQFELRDEAVKLAKRIDPFISINEGAFPANAVAVGSPPTSARFPLYLGAKGANAIVANHPSSFDPGKSPSLGAGLAACLGAAALLLRQLGRPMRPSRLSAWNFAEGIAAEEGPEELGRLNVGTTLQVGAGGVGLCLAYWLAWFGVVDQWMTIDRDLAALHNTNRGLVLFPDQCGWPNGNALPKAQVAAEHLGVKHNTVWYDEFDHNAYVPDVVLPLANEFDVRRIIGARSEPILLHATTARTWESQIHRHIPGRDGCIACRFPPDTSSVAFTCSTGPVTACGGKQTDAALPFLSAAAGLLLTAALFRLQFGLVDQGDHNLWGLCFDNARHFMRPSIHRCTDGCVEIRPPSTHRRIHQSARWSHLDAKAHQF